MFATFASMKSEFQKTIRQASRRHHLWDVFRDFVEMAAISMRNAFERSPDLEKRYLDIAGKYERDELEKICHLLGITTMALEDRHGDFLGEVFQELDLANAATGQFFTPYDVAKLCAGLTIDREKLQAGKRITVQEPACGSGGMLIAMADAMREEGFNPQYQLCAVAVDIDSRAVHMAYIQLSLLGIPAVLYVGNTLTMEMHSEWRTMGFWLHPFRIGEDESTEELRSTEPEAIQTKPVPGQSPSSSEQLSLFQ